MAVRSAIRSALRSSVYSGIADKFGGLSAYAIAGFDPAMVLDFTSEYYRTSRARTTFDNALTHTRAGNATMIDSDGLLKWAPHNLLTYSEDFSNAAWDKLNAGVGSVPTVTSNAGTDPDGGVTADRIQFDLGGGTTSGDVSRLRYAGVTLSASSTQRVWVKSYDGSTYVISLNFGSTTVDRIVTSEWTLIENTSATIGSNAYDIQLRGARGTTNSDTADILLWGAQAYRSDLGGMVNNPDTGDSYVPTTSAARYLPRRGNHTYNGSSWVNAGMALESEARTNLVTYSQDFTKWVNASTVDVGGQTNSLTGLSDATLLYPSSSGANRFIYIASSLSSNIYTRSVFVKAQNKSIFYIDLTGAGIIRAFFDLSSGTVGTVSAGYEARMEAFAGGWYRCSVYNTVAQSLSFAVVCGVADADGATDVTANGTDGIYIYGAQLEAGSTPSSYIKTAGSTVTRAAETLTVAAADMPWPQLTYASEELVNNGNFDTDLSGWILNDDGGLIVWDEDGKISITGISDAVYASQAIDTVIGGYYEISINGPSSGNIHLALGTSENNQSVLYTAVTGEQIYKFVATSETTFITLREFASTGPTLISDISVRKANPLALSIQIDGTMTGGTSTIARWYADASNYITLDAASSAFTFSQDAAGTLDTVTGGSFTSGVNVPFNIASRHGSTFINGAVDGAALTANTTPVALADLSATNFQIGSTFMGNIDTVRALNKDVGDDGIAESTS